MDLGTLLHLHFCHSSYAEPIVEIDGWRIFLDESGFIPAANNLNLVAKLLAWKQGCPRMYCSLVGFENGAFEYRRGMDLPLFGPCVVSRELLCQGRDAILAGVRDEINAALYRMVRLLAEKELIEYRLVQIPVYEVAVGSKCPCCRQTMGEDVLRSCGVS